MLPAQLDFVEVPGPACRSQRLSLRSHFPGRVLPPNPNVRAAFKESSSLFLKANFPRPPFPLLLIPLIIALCGLETSSSASVGLSLLFFTFARYANIVTFVRES